MIKGAVELVTATHVSGWAIEDSMPDQPLQVRVLLGGEEVARSVCDVALRHQSAIASGESARR